MDLLEYVSPQPPHRCERLTERSWHSNDQSFAFRELSQIDLVTRRVLDQNIELGQCVSDLDEGTRGAVEGASGGRKRHAAECEGCHDLCVSCERSDTACLEMIRPCQS